MARAAADARQMAEEEQIPCPRFVLNIVTESSVHVIVIQWFVTFSFFHWKLPETFENTSETGNIYETAVQLF